MPENVAAVQRACNTFTKKYLRGVTPLIVDGDKGTATHKRIMGCKYFLGYGKKRDARVTRPFLNRLKHPRSSKYSPRSLWMRGSRRRVAQRARHASESFKATVSPGVTRFDGVPCAIWLAKKLAVVRAAGRWKGKLVSGWRSPAYSESLCRRMCGAPRCPGRCAGRISNHSGSKDPKGAVDVSDYATFGAECRRLNNGLRNTLGTRDPVHFSRQGN